MDVICQALDLMRNTKDEMFGEKISHIEHAMQSYTYAKLHHPRDTELAVATFWHDIGHSLYTSKSAKALGPTISLMEKDGVMLGVVDHDIHAHNLFHDVLPDRCCDLILNHTLAKRYCMELSRLSAASLETFHQEGGPLTVDERTAFENNPRFEDCLLLRECDDAGKDPNFPYGEHGGKDGILLDAIIDTLQLCNTSIRK